MEEQKTRHTVWLPKNVWDTVEGHYRADNCTTKNEYIEKAIRFYSGYLDTENAAAYLPRVLSEVLEGKLGAFGNRIGGLLFKLTVNDGMLTRLIAAGADIDQVALDKLRVQCVKEAKNTHGIIALEDAVDSLPES